MSSNEQRNGSCLCGAVKVSVNADKTNLGVCHCPKCQQWAGGPLFELECGRQVRFEGQDNIKSFRSSELAARGFCNVCGSHLYIKDLQSGDYGIPPGLFIDKDAIQFNRQVF